MSGILSGPIDGPKRIEQLYPEVPAAAGLVVLHRSSGFRGVIVRIEHDGGLVVRSKNSGLERLFTMSPGAFAVDGETVTLTKPAVTTAEGPARTASGSVAIERQAAKVAKASRILVEGVHDAELVEKVWGDDLRAEGIVVERLDGIDDLASVIDELRPSGDIRIGVLVDHLVPGSKESRIAAAVNNPNVRITGTPFVDIWQAIRPAVAGIDAWPVIERGEPWKAGMCKHFGEPEPGKLWRKLLGQVTSYVDLEPSLVGAVESLIDFVCVGADA